MTIKKSKFGLSPKVVNNCKFWEKKKISFFKKNKQILTQENWKINLIELGKLFKSPKKDRIKSIKQHRKKIIHCKSRVLLRKKTNTLEKIINGITMMPAPLGVGILWLVLSDGLSIRLLFLK